MVSEDGFSFDFSSAEALQQRLREYFHPKDMRPAPARVDIGAEDFTRLQQMAAEDPNGFRLDTRADPQRYRLVSPFGSVVGLVAP